jgi:hypothetical protein
MRIFYFIIIGLLSGSSPSVALAQNIAVIGNFKKEIKISAEDLKKIYLENGVRIDDGLFIQPLDYQEENQLRDEFYQKLLEKNRAQVKAFWARKIFTGKGTPPKAFSGIKEAKEFLQKSTSPYVMYLPEADVEKSDTVLFQFADTAGASRR